ncbi:MAG: hypothetical protein WBD34_10490 [Burkholderiaceae bacterium]
MGIQAKTTFYLKNDLFNEKTVGQLANRLSLADKSIDARKFSRQVLKPFESLELKERIHWIVTVLESTLPSEFEKAVEILKKALPEPLDPSRTDDDFGHFIWVTPGEYVARHGCTSERLATSLNFLRDATMRFSSEFSIRPFLKAFPEETMRFIHDCTGADNYHVRRLASEGIRPYLPWAERVIVPHEEIVSVLNKLHSDPTRFVTRSVANTLNDLSKTNPDLVISTLKEWQKSARQEPGETTWMVRHSLRTLLKQDSASALQMLGYPLDPKFVITNQKVSKRVKIGESFYWQCHLKSSVRQQLKVLLRIGFLKANGSHSEKVFSVSDARFDRGQILEINKQQGFRPMTTRVLYPGNHYAELVVNGNTHKRIQFEVCV